MQTGQQQFGQQGRAAQGAMPDMQQAQQAEKDMFHTILIMLKHNAREYATAVTEANCASVRQTFQRLLNDTLAEQADCYQVMGRQGWYPPAPSAERRDVQSSIQQHRQGAQQIQAVVQARAGGYQGVQPQWQNQWQGGPPQYWQAGGQQNWEQQAPAQPWRPQGEMLQ